MSSQIIGGGSRKMDIPFPFKRRLFQISIAVVVIAAIAYLYLPRERGTSRLQFNPNGHFKIIQVADMHYANGAMSACKDVLPSQSASCSDLNTTAFFNRLIAAEKPDLIVFTGDNIFGSDCNDSRISLDAAFSATINSGIPWAAILGNHDQEGNLDRQQVMQHIATMKNTVSKINPLTSSLASHFGSCGGANDPLPLVDGFGNYNLEIGGVPGSSLAHISVLNLYFLDSGDYSTVPQVNGYGWIKNSQQMWFKQISSRLKAVYKGEPASQNMSAPGLVYFHIPLPEFSEFDASNMTGMKQEAIFSPSLNSGFMATTVEAGDVKAVFVGHDHTNDFCGKMHNVHMCFAGGFGYHAYGKVGWPRRARVVLASLRKIPTGGFQGVEKIATWKRLDDTTLSTIDTQILWTDMEG